MVDDGSRDGSARQAEAAGAIVVRHPINLGQGAALQTGFTYVLECKLSKISSILTISLVKSCLVI